MNEQILKSEILLDIVSSEIAVRMFIKLCSAYKYVSLFI